MWSPLREQAKERGGPTWVVRVVKEQGKSQGFYLGGGGWGLSPYRIDFG